MTSKAPGADCASCPARTGKLLPPLPATGKHRLTVVGEAPCQADLDVGRMFASSAARTLRAGLRAQGIERENTHFTNAVLCECDWRDRPKAALACHGRLQLELGGLAAPIATLGALATQHTAGARKKKHAIQRYRGSVYDPPTASGRRLLPLIHPADVRAAPKWAPIFKGDVERVGRVVFDGWAPPETLEGRRLVIPQTLDSLEEHLTTLQLGAVSIDVETVGLGATRTELVCLGLSDGPLTVVLPWSRASNGRESFWHDGGRKAAQLVTACLAPRIAVTHNGPSFDHVVLSRYGIGNAQWSDPARWDDTLNMCHAFRSHLPKNLYFVVTAAGIDVAPWKMFEDRAASIERLHVYNGRDCLYTILAYNAIRDKVGR